MNLFTKAVQAASELLAKSDVAGHWRVTPDGKRVYVRPYTTARQAETRHAVRHGLEPGDTLADEAGSRGTVKKVTDTHVHTDQDSHPIERVAERIHNGDLSVHRGGKEMTRPHLELHAKRKVKDAERALNDASDRRHPARERAAFDSMLEAFNAVPGPRGMSASPEARHARSSLMREMHSHLIGNPKLIDELEPERANDPMFGHPAGPDRPGFDWYSSMGLDAGDKEPMKNRPIKHAAAYVLNRRINKR